jgi:AcrR family transcriptional regulator
MEGFWADHPGHAGMLRRVPQQSRSRDRVERILDTAAQEVVLHGVDALGTRAIADAAGVPVASLYQYFADKDDILLALVERDLSEMTELVAASLARLEQVSVASLVQTTMDAFAAAYRLRPAFVVVWLRGRANPGVRERRREHNRRIAASLYDEATAWGLFDETAEPFHAEIAVEVGDRLFERAFEHDLEGDQRVLAEACTMVTAYLERYASPRGLTGVPATSRVGASLPAEP